MQFVKLFISIIAATSSIQALVVPATSNFGTVNLAKRNPQDGGIGSIFGGLIGIIQDSIDASKNGGSPKEIAKKILSGLGKVGKGISDTIKGNTSGTQSQQADTAGKVIDVVTKTAGDIAGQIDDGTGSDGESSGDSSNEQSDGDASENAFKSDSSE
ncbi:hypothetical protein BDV3_004460 [Batrachochytrium dendrobatidis]